MWHCSLRETHAHFGWGQNVKYFRLETHPIYCFYLIIFFFFSKYYNFNFYLLLVFCIIINPCFKWNRLCIYLSYACRICLDEPKNTNFTSYYNMCQRPCCLLYLKTQTDMKTIHSATTSSETEHSARNGMAFAGAINKYTRVIYFVENFPYQEVMKIIIIKTSLDERGSTCTKAC